jgi:hypothetical protein
VLWNGAVRKTTFVSSMQLTAAISKADIAKETTALVTVANPAPNAGSSVALPFAVMSATPAAATYVSPWQISATVTSSNLDSMPAEVTVSNPAGASTGFELQ